MNNGPPGFQNAPVTKGLIIVSALLSLVIGIQGGASKCSFSYKDIVQRSHLWKLVTGAFVFSSTPEIIFGLCLLYYFRVFERQIGSNKYLVFLLFSVVVTTLFEVVYLVAYRDINSSGPVSGPYGLIFSSFIPFYFDIPVSTWFKINGFRSSDKAFVYLAGLQLLFSSWTRSLIPGVCGILAGLSYRLNIFHIRRVKFPERLISLVSHISLPTLSIRRPAFSLRGGASRANENLYERQMDEDVATVAPLLEVSSGPSEESISTLVSMGFDRNLAIQALNLAENDINVATNTLLELQSHN